MKKYLLLIVGVVFLSMPIFANTSMISKKLEIKTETQKQVQAIKPKPVLKNTQSPAKKDIMSSSKERQATKGNKSVAVVNTFPWTEGFESGSIPTDWTQTYVSGSHVDWAYLDGNGYGSNPASAYNGSYNACLIDNDAANDQTKLISPAIDFSSASSATLTFYISMERYRSGRINYQDKLKVYYKTSASGSWTLLKSYTNRIRNWTQKTITLPNISSDYYIAFEGNAKNGWGVCIDDVNVTIVAAPTPPTPITSFPWTEDFENGGSIPTDWSDVNVSGSTVWQYLSGNGNSNPSAAHAGSYNACFRDYDSGTDKSKLISPPLDFTGIGAATLSFWYYNELWPNDQDEFKLFYKTSASGSWTQIGSIYNSNISSWTQVTVDLPNLSSDYYIAFEGNALYGYGVCIDDVTVDKIDAPVTDFSADHVNPDLGATVQFTDASTNGPSSWTWSFSPSTITYVSGNANSQNPQVSFDAAGTYDVSLTATNSTGSTLETKSSYIYISDGSFYPNALEFDGSSQYVSINNSASLNTGGPYTDRTIEAWFYCTDVSKSNKQVIFEEGDVTRGFNIYVYNGNLYAGAWDDDSAESNWAGDWVSTSLINSNTWHHVTLVLDGATDTPTAGVMSAYLDGILFDTGDGAKVYAHTGGTNIGRNANTRFHDGIDNSTDSYFGGTIDELRIWNSARTAEEIRGNMYRQLSSTVIASSTELAAYFTMDNNSGTNLRDFAGNLNDGTLTNMTDDNWVKSTVLYDLRQSLDFDGVDDYVSLGNNPDLQLSRSITVEAWIYPRSISQWGAIFGNLQDNGSNESGYGIVIDGPDQKLVWWLQTVGGTPNDYANMTSYVPTLDEWQHIACTFNGSEMKLYVNGVLKDSKARSGDIDWSNLPIEARIGSYFDDNEAYFFDGQIDDIRIYDRALNASQISESMTNHLWGTEDNLIAYYRFDQLNDASQNILYNIKGDYASNNYTENFDSYANNTYVSTVPGWRTWDGTSGTKVDAKTSNTEANSGSYSLKIRKVSGTPNDVIYQNGDLTSGTYSTKFRMYVPSGRYGYFNMEHFDSPGTEWAVDAYFDNSGNGSLTIGGVASAATFSFPSDEWFTVEVLVNLDDDQASFYLNSSSVYSWQWSLNNADGSTGTNQLGCIDFYAEDSNGTPTFYIDDFTVTQSDASSMNGLLVNMDPTLDWEDAITTNQWTGAVNTDWANSSNWLNGGVPISTDIVRIERTETGNYPILNSDQAADKLTIADGASFEVQLNKTFDLGTSLINYGTLTVDGAMNLGGMLMNYETIDLSGEMTVGGRLINNGDFNISSDANVTGSLIDNGEVSGYGDFHIQRYMASSEKWHLISSPVIDAKAKVFLDRYLLSYNEPSDTWDNILLENVRLRPMTGYASMTNSSSSTSDTYQFNGDINTGNYTYTLLHSGTNPENLNFNLIGNPYPSSIDWDLISIPTGMDNAISMLKPDGQYAYYANRISINGGSQMIAPGQGFWVRVTPGTASSTVVDLTLTNAARSHSAKDDYFKSANASNNEYQFSMFATNDKVTDETVLVFNNATLPQFDGDFDAMKFLAYERNIPNIYFIGANEEKLAIDTRPETPEVNVGFSMNESARNVKISIKEAPNFAGIILEDLFNGNKVDLLKDDYVFDYATTDNANRFKLHFSFLGTEDVATAAEELKIFTNESDLIIKSKESLVNSSVQVYDIQGRMVYSTDLQSATYQRIPLSLGTGNYIVKLIGAKKVTSQKVFLK